MWTVYTEALTGIWRGGMRRRKAKTATTAVPNAINNMIRNSVKPDPNHVAKLSKIMNGKGTVIYSVENKYVEMVFLVVFAGMRYIVWSCDFLLHSTHSTIKFKLSNRSIFYCDKTDLFCFGMCGSAFPRRFSCSACFLSIHD
jgi:hypothetical protein